MTEKKRIALLLEYDGTAYAGWQRQANVRTVQGVVENALAKLCGESVTFYGCGGTDGGVHARGHVSHFNSHCTVPPERLYLALGTLLPDDISVLDAAIVPDTFHARFGSRGKQYSYYIWNNRFRSALLSRYSAHESRALDIDAMHRACDYLIGKHDFRCFMAAGSTAKTTIRTLYKVELSGETGGLLRLTISGDAFLYNMVRIIAGTLLYVGLGKFEPEMIEAMLASGDRTLAGKTLTAAGLFLDEVYYDENPFPACYNKQNNLAALLAGQESGGNDEFLE